MAEEDLSSESYPIQESNAPSQLSQSTNKVHGEALNIAHSRDLHPVNRV